MIAMEFRESGKFYDFVAMIVCMKDGWPLAAD